jgi:hypothetical protein
MKINAQAKILADQALTKALEVNIVDEGSTSSVINILCKKNPVMAVFILNFNTLAFPQPSNAFDSLGEAYFTLGDKTLSDKNYSISRKLNSTFIKYIHNSKLLKVTLQQVM